MPFFHRRSEDEKQRDAEEQRSLQDQEADRDASLAALDQGGIPVQAQRRLDDLRAQEGHFFTSDLSVDEFVLSRQAGFRAVSQVMGSSIYHVGWQFMPGAYGYSQELGAVSRAMNHARALALGRLAQEAQRVGAHAVIGVHIRRGRYEWSADLIEFTAIGTAVQLAGERASSSPGLTNLSGQDFWKLYASGYWPLGVVAASSVYYVVASWQTQMAGSAWTGWFNQELGDFTQGVYTARHLAMSQVGEQARQLRAQGVVGVEIEQEEEEHEVNLGNDRERTDVIFTFHATGTAIVERSAAAPLPAIHPVVDLRS